MDKLITRLPIIMIGLSILLFSGCRLTEIDPPEKWAIVTFLNSSNQDITVKMINHPLSGNGADILTTIEASNEKGTKKFVYENDAINEYFSIIADNNDVKIQIIIDNNVVKQWNGPSGNFGDNINSPFNYDSWKFESIEPTGNNIVGKITFTITNDDIE